MSADLENRHKFVVFIGRANSFFVVVYGASCENRYVVLLINSSPSELCVVAGKEPQQL